MNKAAAEGIAAAVDRLDSDDNLRVGILTGAGGTFCSGMDLKGFLRGESPSIEGRGFGGITQKGPVKPLIAAVEGYGYSEGLAARSEEDWTGENLDAFLADPSPVGPEQAFQKLELLLRRSNSAPARRPQPPQRRPGMQMR